MGFLDPVFDPFLRLPPLLAVLLISLLISVIMNLIYKWMTDQKKMKAMREELKKHQQDMKKHKQNPKKMMEIQKKAMEINMNYMMQSMKPTIITFLPIILIFGWLNGNLAYEPIHPGVSFNTTMVLQAGTTGYATISAPNGITILSNATQMIENNAAKWSLKGDAGDYILEYTYDGKPYVREVTITTGHDYKQPIEKLKGGKVTSLIIGNKPMKVLNLFGWKMGWLGAYIIFSLVFSMALKKLMKLH
jgi:uncharacterized membrane protein (DUF106 family)